MEDCDSDADFSLSLPPRVVGKVSGHLVMKVDEVLWARKAPGAVSAVVLWWGAENPTTFRPIDVSEKASLQNRTCVMYEIRTSKDLFESYLKKCGSLKIVISDKYGMAIGCVIIPNIHQMLQVSPFSGYYSIINQFGNRVGDLQVSFTLRLSDNAGGMSSLEKRCVVKALKGKKQPNSNIVCGKTKPPSNTQGEKVTTQETAAFEKLRKSSELNTIHEKSKYENIDKINQGNSISNDVIHENSRVNNVPSRNSPTTNIISLILEHGKKLQTAMTNSVIEDEKNTTSEHYCDPMAGISTCRMSANINELHHQHNNFEVQNYVSGMRKGKQGIPSAQKQKVIDYLAGKPMSEEDECEAINALRCITPTQEIVSEMPGPGSKESCAEMLTNITDYAVINNLENNLKSSFEIDSAVLSQVNCIRISILSLVLNSVGQKRIDSSSTCLKKSSKSSTSIQPPPGITYFVEYQNPSASGSNRYALDIIRYCSKRQRGHEVSFGDRSVHNIPSLLRNSLSEHSSLGSFIVSLTFKVCARHLNQRVPVMLGSAAPDSAMFLLGSPHLRHDYALPVVASDRLPVALLKVCLELGRDRIHFGGLFDPENNSLGAASSQGNSARLTPKNSKVALCNIAKPSALVTRNVSRKLTLKNPKWREELSRDYEINANKVVKQLLANVTANLKQSDSSESSTVSSTERSELASTSGLYISSKTKNEKQSQQSNGLKLESQLHFHKKFRHYCKHEIAITIQQINGCVLLDGTFANDRDCFVSYKFPSWDASINGSVEWNVYSSEPTVCLGDTWFRPTCQVHSVVLPEVLSLHNFLLQSFKMRGLSNDMNSTVALSVCVRHYGQKVKDVLFAQAFLSHSSFLSLENAYNEAASRDASFSDLSCASIVLNLPLHLCSDGGSSHQDGGGCLKIKMDYRQVQSKQSSCNVPQSHGDSATDVSKTFALDEKMKPSSIYPKKPKRTVNQSVLETVNLLNETTFVPNWAKSEDKQTSACGVMNGGSNLHLINNAETMSSMNRRNANMKMKDQLYTTTDCQPLTKRKHGDHACWEPVTHDKFEGQDGSRVSRPSRQVGDFPRENTVKHIDDSHLDMSCVSPSRTVSCQDLLLGAVNDVASANLLKEKLPGSVKDLRYADAETTINPTELSRQQFEEKSTSPMPSSPLCEVHRAACEHKSTSTDTIAYVMSASQTSPRQTDNEEKPFTASETALIRLLEKDTPLATKSDEYCPSEIIECEVGGVDSNINELMNMPKEAFGSSCESNSVSALTEQNAVSECRIEAQTSSTSFPAKVGVECALHVQYSCKESVSYVYVSCHPLEVSSCDKDDSLASETHALYVSPAVTSKSDPEWCWFCDVRLPADLLTSAIRRLVFKVWERENCVIENDLHTKAGSLIGFAAVDLTVLAAGLPLVSGWFNIMDFTGLCRGQIKLSVEPYEDISRFLDSGRPSSKRRPTKTPSSQMYIAHCAYPNFPSHVVQHPDMRVQVMEPQVAEEAVAAVLSGYQFLIQHCKNLSEKLPNASDPILKSCLPENGVRDAQGGRPGTASTVPVAPVVLSAAGSDEENRLDASARLREKLSELDILTKMLKAKLVTRAESILSSQTPYALYALPTDDLNIFPRSVHGDDGKVLDRNLRASESRNAATENSETRSRKSLKAEGINSNLIGSERMPIERIETVGCSDESREHNRGASYTKLHASSTGREAVKSRRTWERHEELIDLQSLDEEEDEAQFEDVAEWLSSAAQPHGSNPLLFHDLAGNMTRSSSNIRIVELDDGSDDGILRSAGRGDQTYRKDACVSQEQKRSDAAAYEWARRRETGAPAATSASGISSARQVKSYARQSSQLGSPLESLSCFLFFQQQFGRFYIAAFPVCLSGCDSQRISPAQGV